MSRSPDRPGWGREIERRFWLVIDTVASTEDAAAACGVAAAVASRWFRQAAGTSP